MELFVNILNFSINKSLILVHEQKYYSPSVRKFVVTEDIYSLDIKILLV